MIGAKRGVYFSDNNIFNEPGFDAVGETRHTYKDWGMFLQSVEIGVPDVQTYMVEIPGRDGLVDLTESVYGSKLHYKNRQIVIKLFAPTEQGKFPHILSTLMTELHGKKKYIMFDDDQAFYYYGRLTVDSVETSAFKGIITLVADCDPYKTERYWKVRNVIVDGLRVSDWIWDSFSFVNGYVWNNIYNFASDKAVISGSTKIIENKIEILGDGTTVTFNSNSSQDIRIDISNSYYHIDGGTVSSTSTFSITLDRGRYIVDAVAPSYSNSVVWSSWRSRVI